MDDLADILPAAVSFTVAGREVTIQKLRFRQVPEFAAAVAAPWVLIGAGRWMEAAALHNDDLCRAVALLTGEPEAWLRDLLVDEFVALAAEVARVNLDFFTAAVMPAVTAAMAVVTAERAGSTLPTA
jgi:hypothetical protein